MARTNITTRIRETCRKRFDTAGLSLGAAAFALGGLLTASIVLAPIGIPIIIVSLPLLLEPNRRRNPNCA